MLGCTPLAWHWRLLLAACVASSGGAGGDPKRQKWPAAARSRSPRGRGGGELAGAMEQRRGHGARLDVPLGRVTCVQLVCTLGHSMSMYWPRRAIVTRRAAPVLRANTPTRATGIACVRMGVARDVQRARSALRVSCTSLYVVVVPVSEYLVKFTFFSVDLAACFMRRGATLQSTWHKSIL